MVNEEHYGRSSSLLDYSPKRSMTKNNNPQEQQQTRVNRTSWLRDMLGEIL